MKNDAYWVERMKLLEKALLDKGYDYTQNLEAQFAEATRSVEKELAAWYQRLAKNNEINLADAKKLLNAGELKEFRWSVEEYIKHGRENALDGRWLRELENASARVHISYLDSMKLQLQQQAEALYGSQQDGVDTLAREIYSDSFYHTAFELQKGFGVGWGFMTLNEGTIRKVLSKPWTADGQTFRDRCWTNKEALVRSVNKNLTQMIIRGEAPDRAIAAISKEFGVSRRKAGRLVMTESAAFASAGQRDCFNALEVEKYRIVETLDSETCPLCGELDGKVFKMSDFAIGITAPPFHPCCRGCTCPHFDDMRAGARFARDVETDKTYRVSGDMTYQEWKKQQDAIHGAGAVDLARKMHYRETVDSAQYERYKGILGKNVPASLKEFQQLKYTSADDYAMLRLRYADQKLRNRLASDSVNKTIHLVRQGKHLLKHNNYVNGNSYLTVAPQEIQDMVSQYAGTGKIVRDTKGIWTHKEKIYTDKIIGYNVNIENKNAVETKAFMISYSKAGVHIVPADDARKG